MSNRPHLPITASRIRRDGWTNGKRVTFFVTLAATGSVTLAAALARAEAGRDRSLPPSQCVVPVHRCTIESGKPLANAAKQSDADRFEERA